MHKVECPAGPRRPRSPRSVPSEPRRESWRALQPIRSWSRDQIDHVSARDPLRFSEFGMSAEALERENRETRRANEILKTATAATAVPGLRGTWISALFQAESPMCSPNEPRSRG
jgi:hypothetical protein